MDGQRALIYSRIRENRLDPSDNDLTRGERQQAVVEAMTDKLVGPGTFVRLPFIGGDLVKPLTTDLSAGQLLQLGWVKFRANSSRALHCRLGGEPQSIGGESVLSGRRRTRPRSRCSPAARRRSRHRRARRSAPAASWAARRWQAILSRRRGRAFFSPAPESLSDFFSDEPESPLPPSFGAASVFLRPPAPVVGRVEAGALEVHRDGVEHLLDGALAADLARLDRGVRNPLEDLEGMPVGTAVLVDRHGARRLAATI